MAGTVRRLAAAVLSAFGLALACISLVEAAPSCRQLEAELARPSPSAGNRATGKYDDAIARQRDQIAKTSQRARSAGCGFSFFARSGSQCGELNATIKRMQANLASLQATRTQLSKGAGRTDRARILAALESKGCRPKKSDATARGSDTSSKNKGAQANAGVVIRGAGGSSIYYPANRPYRTQCVRTCDGYFFPMSKSSTPADFQRDQARCEAACPGTRVEMFYSEAGSANSADMVSAVTGRRYADLPRALVFRRLDIPVEAGCSCGGSVAQGASFVGESAAPDTLISANPGSSVIDVKAPRGREKAAAVETAQPLPEREVEENRKVRVVGPMFLPDR
ncbi:DUF2865 domain-containing protein [Aquamicrobium ahrensii]|uniref:DUF2865 domain-containing protein n=1 Tax=Aquamicrobium ahrensii TaxID=469551 RepID=A0ABV2KF77_9HYPH